MDSFLTVLVVSLSLCPIPVFRDVSPGLVSLSRCRVCVARLQSASGCPPLVPSSPTVYRLCTYKECEELKLSLSKKKTHTHTITENGFDFNIFASKESDLNPLISKHAFIYH